jgi:hypothetical protein
VKSLLTDPVVLICSGIIVAGLVGLFWGIGKFRRVMSASPGRGSFDDALSSAPEARDLDFRAPVIGSAPAASAVGKDVAERLESMTLRLAEMQAALTKQSSGAGSPAAAGGVGQGFSPETIDKLLKIIGNVIQQVDILQKNLNPAKDGSTPKVDRTASPFTRL